MTVLLYVLGVLLVVLGVGLSIGLHEIGHLVPAKKFGVKVTQYMVGFGPTLWSTRRGETEYGLKAIPLGGYIRMIGMFPPRPGDAEGTIRVSSTGRFTQLADEARQLSLEEIKPGDEDRVFYKLSVPKKVVVMMGGPVMNLLIAVVLLSGIVTLYGTQEVKDGAVVATVTECVVPASAAATKTTCAASDPKTPAFLAGIKPGDRLVSVAGQPIKRTSDVGRLIRPRIGEATPVVVLRDGAEQTLQVTPVQNTIQQVAADGTPLVDDAGTPWSSSAGFLGVSSAPVLARERQSVTVVPGIVGNYVGHVGELFLHLPQRLTDVAQAAFGSEARDPNGPQSVVGRRPDRRGGRRRSGRWARQQRARTVHDDPVPHGRPQHRVVRLQPHPAPAARRRPRRGRAVGRAQAQRRSPPPPPRPRSRGRRQGAAGGVCRVDSPDRHVGPADLRRLRQTCPARLTPPPPGSPVDAQCLDGGDRHGPSRRALRGDQHQHQAGSSDDGQRLEGQPPDDAP